MSASALPQIMMVVKQPRDGRTEAERQNQKSARKEGVDIYFFFSLFFSNSCQIMRGAAPVLFWGGGGGTGRTVHFQSTVGNRVQLQPRLDASADL